MASKYVVPRGEKINNSDEKSNKDKSEKKIRPKFICKPFKVLTA